MGGLPRRGPLDAAEWGLHQPRGAEGFSGALRKLTQKSPSNFMTPREVPVKVSVKQLLDVGGGKRILQEMDLENPGIEGEHGSYSFYVSDAADKFKQFANSILPYDIDMTRQINIEEY